MDQLVRMLKESILFSDLSEETIKNEILPHGRLWEIPKGNYLISFQEKVNDFGVVIRGRFNLLHIYGNGNLGIMGVLEPGDLFGMDLIYTKSRISPYYAEPDGAGGNIEIQTKHVYTSELGSQKRGILSRDAIC